jgi:hypothetical protein
MSLPAGDSAEQREAENAIIRALSLKLKVNLLPKRIELKPAGWLMVDGFCEDPLIACEAWAHIGPPKAAQLAKVMKDALKLLYVKKLLGPTRLILAFADRDAARPFQTNSWVSKCLSEHDIEIAVLSIPTVMQMRIIQAQKRQYR